MSDKTTGLRCKDGDACAAGQRPCPSPAACGCEAALPDALRKEYRATMPTEVLHLWAKDALECISILQSQHLQELRAYELTAQNLRAELVVEAGRTAEEKLRADQMTEQHRMQANMRKDLEIRVQQAEHVAHALALDKIALEAQLSSVGAGGVESLRKREQDSHDFKNFHRLLCDRFDYTHDERDWRRDQVSLIEHIAAQPARECLQQSAVARDTAAEKPVAGRYVLAWLEGATVPIRAMWVPAMWLKADDECAEDWAEYDEAKDEYFCPEGWYEKNEHEEQNWSVSTPVVAWMELPRLDSALQAAPPAPADAIEALRQAKSVISSINRGTQHQIERFGEPVFWQRGEWIGWAVNEALPLIDAALAAQPAPAGVAVPAGFALVPTRLTSGMDAVMAEEGWQWADLLAAAEATTEAEYAAQGQDAEPLFWYRPVCNGEMYEGPHHNNSNLGKMLRTEKPSEWRPLYAHPPCAPVAASDTESVLIDGIAYEVPAAVAGELLSLHLDLLAAAPAQAVAEPVEVDLPDVEDMAHSAVQEALSYGVSHDVFHRWMRSVMDKTVQALAAAPIQAQEDAQDAALAERERICAAIQAEDDYCVTQGDYMLDSNDCIKVARGEWVRPVFDAARAAQGGAA